MLQIPALPAELRQDPAAAIGALLLATATAVIVAALAFEHIGGYIPCPLCMQQRYAYYAGIPALVGALALLRSGRTMSAAGIFLLVGTAFVVNAGLGIYQAGAEWKFWQITSCAASGGLPDFDINKLNIENAPICGVASWRFLGLSFAGWNVVASAVLALGASTAALKAWRRLP
jgi:disulfide bond formation protein DsbB